MNYVYIAVSINTKNRTTVNCQFRWYNWTTSPCFTSPHRLSRYVFPTFYLLLHIDVLEDIFHMNIPEFNPVTHGNLPRFIASACALTAGSVWIMIALQGPDMFNMEMSVWQRLGWPFFIVYRMIQKARHPEKFRLDAPKGGALPGSFSRPFRIETLSSKSHLFILCSDNWTGQT